LQQAKFNVKLFLRIRRMSIKILSNVQYESHDHFAKQNLNKEKQITFKANLSKVITKSTHNAVFKTSLQDEFIQGAKKEIAKSLSGEFANNTKNKIGRFLKSIKDSIGAVFKKQHKDIELSAEEKALVVFNKGPRNVNTNADKNKHIARNDAAYKAGEISKQEHDTTERKIIRYYEQAKKLPSKFSSTAIERNNPGFKGGESEFSGPPPGHSATVVQQAIHQAQQSMQGHMNSMSMQELILYKEFIEKKNKLRRGR